MQTQIPDLLEKIRQQFDSAPYPSIALDESPKKNPSLLQIHNLVTPYYLRNQKVVETKGKVILDAGCGTGYKSLILAEANPGAKIVGIDISEQSVNLAKQRLEYHGFDNAEFHVLGVEELPNTNWQFDYINCDELLYLFSDIAEALKAMKTVLKPEGIIRSNLHSSIQRFDYYCAQKVFAMMSLMDSNPEDLEIDIVVDIMKALKDKVTIKERTWKPKYEEDPKETILMNYLFHGDKGYSISDMFDAFRAADLEFISMVNWRKWNLMSLFKEPENLPTFLAMSLPDISVEEELQLFELLHPVNRLLDFWCGHTNTAQSFVPVDEWNDTEWRKSQVYLNPQLQTSKFQEDLISSCREIKPFIISEDLPVIEEPISIDSSMAICLIPLTEKSQSIISLVDRWISLRPLDPLTLEPTNPEQAFYMVQQLLFNLKNLGYVMLES
ncbi:MAG: class I SAM-dependent methyltransferase [Cyanobacteria bacterium P01_A01_bin.84]